MSVCEDFKYSAIAHQKEVAECLCVKTLNIQQLAIRKKLQNVCV